MKAIGYDDYQGPRLTRQQQIARMHRVIENELTEKQRRAVLGYYVDKKTMPESSASANRLSAAPSSAPKSACAGVCGIK